MLSLVRQSSNYKHIDHSETVDDGDDIRQTGSVKEIHNASLNTNNTYIQAYMHVYTYIPDGIVATVADETPL